MLAVVRRRRQVFSVGIHFERAETRPMKLSTSRLIAVTINFSFRCEIWITYEMEGVAISKGHYRTSAPGSEPTVSHSSNKDDNVSRDGCTRDLRREKKMNRPRPGVPN